MAVRYGTASHGTVRAGIRVRVRVRARARVRVRVRVRVLSERVPVYSKPRTVLSTSTRTTYWQDFSLLGACRVCWKLRYGTDLYSYPYSNAHLLGDCETKQKTKSIDFLQRTARHVSYRAVGYEQESIIIVNHSRGFYFEIQQEQRSTQEEHNTNVMQFLLRPIKQHQHAALCFHVAGIGSTDGIVPDVSYA